MKKPYLLVLCAIIALPAALTSLEVEYKGEFRTRGVYVLNKDLDNSTSGKVALIDTRLRLWINPKIDDTLKLVFGIEIGDISWGEEVGSFTLDNNLGKASGGAQGTDGVNIETKHIYMEYKPAKGMRLQIGLMPFAAPSQMVVDSDAAALSFRWKMLGLRWTALYARAFAGPRGKGVIPGEDEQQANKNADIINLDNDRNDYLLSAEYKKGKFSVTGWVLFDDNNRFSYDGIASTVPYAAYYGLTSDLFYLGIRVKSKSKTLDYEINGVLNTGRISAIETIGSEGSVNVLAWAVQAKASYALNKSTAVGLNIRAISGNSTSQTNNTAMVRQFQVLDAGDGDSNSMLSLLFGGGVFNHQSYFYHKTASARMVNVTTGYFVRNDPGITSFETYFEKKFFGKKLRLRLIAGYAMTTKAVAGGHNDLGLETDLALRYRASKHLDFYLTAAFLLPGKALGPTLALDNAVLDEPRNFGEDPAFKIEAMARIRF